MLSIYEYLFSVNSLGVSEIWNDTDIPDSHLGKWQKNGDRTSTQINKHKNM